MIWLITSVINLAKVCVIGSLVHILKRGLAPLHSRRTAGYILSVHLADHIFRPLGSLNTNCLIDTSRNLDCSHTSHSKLSSQSRALISHFSLLLNRVRLAERASLIWFPGCSKRRKTCKHSKQSKRQSRYLTSLTRRLWRIWHYGLFQTSTFRMASSLTSQDYIATFLEDSLVLLETPLLQTLSFLLSLFSMVASI